MYSPATSLSKSVFDFFQRHLTVRNGNFLFSFQEGNENVQTEYWSEDLHLVPSSTGIWLAYDGFPFQIKHLFLSHSAADILCFCHRFPFWLKISDNIAFAALGLIASSSQISLVKRQFFNAKVHTLFDAGITGRVADCKVSLWLYKREARFWFQDENVQIRYKRKYYSMPANTFSLSLFEKTVGLRSGVRTHKPKNGANSYSEYINSKF
jgi:hypothetical protein